MHIEHLHLINFKNYADRSFSFIPGVNVITGHNGMGKTNLLDAIHYLCFCKGFLNPSDSQNILHEAPFFVLEGRFWREGKEENLYCGFKRGNKKQFKRNKKEYEKLAAHIGLFPVVVISPLDSELITGGSEDRRRFIDGLISQFDHDYLDELMAYNRLLAQRNALLKLFFEQKNFNQESLDVYDEQLAPLGTSIFRKRRQFIEEFLPVFEEYYHFIAGSLELPSLVYRSHLSEDVSFINLMAEARERDRFMLYTTKGTHKDDLDFQLEGFPIKRFGSQGQQKSYLTALKLAEHEFLGRKMKFRPVLLLDDIFDKLDTNRVSRLIRKVSEEGFGQVFITDTGKEKISSVFDTFGVSATFIEL